MLDIRVFWWFGLALVTLLRLEAAARMPLQGTEAYYWLWSQHLAAGYYDHPPLLAWSIAASQALLGKGELAVRLPSLCGGTLATLCMWWLARDLAGPRAGAWAGLIALCIPYMSFECVVAFPDGLVLGLCSLSLCLTWKGRYYLGGLVAGLGGLAKFTAALPGVAYLAFEAGGGRESRGRLARTLGWIALSLVGVAPFLGWNATHHWETFAFQLGQRQSAEAHLTPWRFAEFAGLQLAILSPILGWLLLVGVVRSWREGGPRGRFLWMMSVIPMAPFVVYAFFHKIEPQWPFLAWVTPVVALGVAAHECAWYRRRVVWGLLVGAALSILVLLLALEPRVLFAIKGPRPEGTSALQPYACETIAKVAVQEAGTRFLLTRDHGLSSAFTFYSGSTFHWYSQNLHGREFLHWEDYAALKGHDALFVDVAQSADRAYVKWWLQQGFRQVDEPSVVLVEWKGRPARTFALWPCHGFKGHAPDPSLRPENSPQL